MSLASPLRLDWKDGCCFLGHDTCLFIFVVYIIYLCIAIYLFMKDGVGYIVLVGETVSILLSYLRRED
jgi:hypothetical protein